MSKEQTAIEMIEDVAFELHERGDGVQAAFLLGAVHAMYRGESDCPWEDAAEHKAYVLGGAAALYVTIDDGPGPEA